LIDAAAVDGAGHWRALWLVTLPNLKPALSALTIVLSINCWNEYFWPLLIIESPEARTAQLGLRRFLDEDFGD
jgi:ABC-type glycerol-3-phosphate transport system permease component